LLRWIAPRARFASFSEAGISLFAYNAGTGAKRGQILWSTADISFSGLLICSKNLAL
jgi:hypothetical protein